ncbi:hypothetical protein D3C81_1838770 [compost metagenome]
MKSTMPAFIICTTMGTSAWPVMTMTGQAAPRSSRMRRTTSAPSMSGMRMSVMTQAVASSGRALKKSRPLEKPRARMPTPRSRTSRESRTAASSSIMNTEWRLMDARRPFHGSG